MCPTQVRQLSDHLKRNKKPKETFVSFGLVAGKGGMKTAANSLSQRQRKILALIEDHQMMRVDDLSERFSTSHQTIRKDLQRLADLHHIVRSHGGATVVGGVEYTSPSQRIGVAAAQKQAIGAVVAGLIPQTCAVFLNAGTTTVQAARLLSGHQQLRVITDNVDLAAEIRGFSGLEVIVPGGAVRRSDGAILGAEAVDYIRQFRVDFAVIGASAVSQDGALLDFDLAEVQICRAMMSKAQHTILALDSSKFGRSAPVELGQLADVNTIVTDSDVGDWVKPLCELHDVELVIAN